MFLGPFFARGVWQDARFFFFFSSTKMEFSLEDFVADPTLEKLDGCNKNNLIFIAARFEIPMVK